MATSSAAAAAAAGKNASKFRYLSAWFCPFAHRATLALEHHAGRVDYEWVEALVRLVAIGAPIVMALLRQQRHRKLTPFRTRHSTSQGWEQRKDENNVTGTGKEWWYHWKADELRRSNPSALVPTLIPVTNIATNQVDETKSVYESLVTIDFIDQVSGATGTERLVPEDPYEAARCRIWADRVNRDCCSPYYGVLVRLEPDERMEHFQKLLSGLKSFGEELKKTSGPLFLADAQLSNVDLALLPWAFRYYVFEFYRGSDYVIPRDDPALEPYHEWYNHVMKLDSVKRTLPDKDRYLKHIGKYADSSARSKVANAVRRGVAAHELDDEKDEY